MWLLGLKCLCVNTQILRMILLQIEPQLLSGKHVMVAAHANSLRAIIMYLDNLTSQEVILQSIQFFFSSLFYACFVAYKVKL